MASMSQEHKKHIVDMLKVALKGSGLKWSLRVEHHSTLVMTITEGPIDFIGNYIETYNNRNSGDDGREMPTGNMSINVYWHKERFTGQTLELVDKIVNCLNDGNWDKSDIQTDYFNAGHYVSLNIGTHDKPYKLVS
jgi:hypothetical protein